MAEKPGEPSDGMTQQSREKPPWVRLLLSDEIVEMVISGITAFSYALPLLGASGFVVLSYVCSYEGVSMVWNGIKTHVGVPIDDILPLEGFGVGAVFGICCFVVCGRGFTRLIQSPLERLLVSSTWFWVLLVLCGTSVLASSLAISLCSVGWRPQWSWSWIWRVLLLGLCVSALSVVLRLLWRPAKERMGKLPLFVAIAIWAGIAIGAFLLAMWWLGRVPFWQLKLDPRKQAENIVKIALTLVGGVGAVAYLVIKYQERQQAGRAEKREKDRTVDTKVQDAINQLGSDKASTRIAGVYALTDIADRYKGGYRQRVVDILCGYLRSDRETYPLGEDGKPATGLPRSGDADKAVESTILSMFVAHLKKGSRDENDMMVRQQVRSDQLWGDCDFDLHGAEFHEMTDFADCVFEGKTDFRLAKFTNISSFSGVKFTDAADFRGAEFKVGVYFICTKFACDARFSGAELTKADFTGAEFEGEANFDRLEDTAITAVSTKFLGDVIFHNAEFEGKADFRGAEFEGKADFTGVEFEGEAIFNQDDVDATETTAVSTKFLGDAIFHNAEFTGYTDFTGVEFKGEAIFNQDDVDATETTAVSTKFLGDVIFHNAEFEGEADFTGVEFERMADFTGVEFKGEADFTGVEFKGEAIFNQDDVELNQDDVDATETTAVSTKFLGDAIFHNAEFTGYTDFTGVEFERMAYFTGAEFKGEAGFNETIFRDGAYFGLTKFRGSAKFSGIKGQQPSFAGGKFNRELHDVKREDGTDFYVFDPSLIPENNAGLPKDAVWYKFPDDDKDDGAATDR